MLDGWAEVEPPEGSGGSEAQLSAGNASSSNRHPERRTGARSRLIGKPPAMP
jgi:hypothetical protein